MNYILFISSLIFFAPRYKKLSWADFHGTRTDSKTIALTVTTIELTESQVNGRYTFEVTLEFDKDASWTVTNDPGKLIHEQGHFDLSFLAQRKIVKELLPFQGTTQPKAAERLYDKRIREWGERERRYDLETNHSLDISAQKRWGRVIERELAISCTF